MTVAALTARSCSRRRRAATRERRRRPGERYVRASGRFGPTALYDASIALTMRAGRWRPVLRDRLLTDVPHGGRVLDVGAGTGTLAIALAAARPDIDVLAVDGDPEALALARPEPGVERVQWREGLAGELDLPDGSVDAAVMSLVLHHLGPQTKRRALLDLRRVLRPSGQLHIADWGRPATPLLRELTARAACFGHSSASRGVVRRTSGPPVGETRCEPGGARADARRGIHRIMLEADEGISQPASRPGHRRSLRRCRSAEGPGLVSGPGGRPLRPRSGSRPQTWCWDRRLPRRASAAAAGRRACPVPAPGRLFVRPFTSA